MSDDIKTCPHCTLVKGFGPHIERHIFRCGHGIPISVGKKPQPEEKPAQPVPA